MTAPAGNQETEEEHKLGVGVFLIHMEHGLVEDLKQLAEVLRVDEDGDVQLSYSVNELNQASDHIHVYVFYGFGTFGVKDPCQNFSYQRVEGLSDHVVHLLCLPHLLASVRKDSETTHILRVADEA